MMMMMIPGYVEGTDQIPNEMRLCVHRSLKEKKKKKKRKGSTVLE